ncbi:hypothetical protein ACPTG4_08815 [Enterococcus faecalis]|uniref:hypothetical protein n=1 Tax=Enterococcus faecalis TaxID=1351 RepID=UPI00229A4143|nr:hypothetical protein [Enterococcus faecalis]MDK7897373.1 hypothetical protein [Enterococcus faecalis]HCY9046350.1 hypothetical protein [Enterococcus faecalis]
MGRFFFTSVWYVLKLLVILVIIYICFRLLLSGEGMPTPKEFIISVLNFVTDQVQVIIHWAQQRFCFE